MAFPPKVPPGAVEQILAAALGGLPPGCACGHTKAEHAAASGECMALAGGPYELPPRMLQSCPCREFRVVGSTSPGPLPGPAHVPRRGWLSRALECLGVASEMARAVVGAARSTIDAWRASWDGRAPIGPCSREPPHRCGVNGPCNGWPRP
jgi:hypothetical protein